MRRTWVNEFGQLCHKHLVGETVHYYCRDERNAQAHLHTQQGPWPAVIMESEEPDARWAILFVLLPSGETRTTGRVPRYTTDPRAIRPPPDDVRLDRFSPSGERRLEVNEWWDWRPTISTGVMHL